jgi:hypothetical protein
MNNSNLPIVDSLFGLSFATVGDIGSRTEIEAPRLLRDGFIYPAIIPVLDYEFDLEWKGDEILGCVDGLICSDRIADLMLQSDLTGFTITDVIVSHSQNWQALYRRTRLPPFKRIVVAEVCRVVGYRTLRSRPEADISTVAPLQEPINWDDPAPEPYFDVVVTQRFIDAVSRDAIPNSLVYPVEVA